jgi:hypothetical protein
MTARIQAMNNPPKPTAGKVFVPNTFLAQMAPNAFANFNAPAPASTPHSGPGDQSQTARSGPSPGGQQDLAKQAQHFAEGIHQQVHFGLSAAHEAAEGLAHSHGISLPFHDHHAQAAPTALGPSGGTINMQDGFLDWSACVRFKKFELRESLAVHIFLKEPPSDPTEWIGCDGYVGSHFAFVNSTLDQCANCVGRAEMINEGYVQLNEGIAKFSDLHSFDADVVEPYLKTHMKWRVQKADLRTPIPTSELSSLEVTVLSARISMAPHSMVPSMGEIKRHMQITLGRQGGFRHA